MGARFAGLFGRFICLLGMAEKPKNKRRVVYDRLNAV